MPTPPIALAPPTAKRDFRVQWSALSECGNHLQRRIAQNPQTPHSELRLPNSELPPRPMQLTISTRRNTLTPSLRAKLQAAKGPAARKALEAIGLTVISMTQRSFTQANLRPTAWPPLKPSTIKQKTKAGHGTKPLRSTGHLAHSPRIIKVTNRNVTVGSDRKTPKGGHSLAAIHQLGTKDRRIPARPFFPFDKNGRPTDRAKKNILAAADRALRPQIRRK